LVAVDGVDGVDGVVVVDDLVELDAVVDLDAVGDLVELDDFVELDVMGDLCALGTRFGSLNMRHDDNIGRRSLYTISCGFGVLHHLAYLRISPTLNSNIILCNNRYNCL